VDIGAARRIAERWSDALMSETPMAELGTALKENRAAQVAEIACVFLPAFAVVSVRWRVVGSNPIARQAFVRVANC
jgi:uncharacterized membrane protein YfbV (UPF0208 family)